MKIEVTVCDKCKDATRATKHYTVACDGLEGETDRCEEHGAPLAAVLVPGAEETTGSRAVATPRKVIRPAKKTSTPRRRTPMMSLEEIERAKASQKK